MYPITSAFNLEASCNNEVTSLQSQDTFVETTPASNVQMVLKSSSSFHQLFTYNSFLPGNGCCDTGLTCVIYGKMAGCCPDGQDCSDSDDTDIDDWDGEIDDPDGEVYNERTIVIVAAIVDDDDDSTVPADNASTNGSSPDTSDDASSASEDITTLSTDDSSDSDAAAEPDSSSIVLRSWWSRETWRKTVFI
ncbi:hypothetical protein C8J56DRAFT_895977 [Mycena floridula]|nr:hypothetical protein C8J56DRAFT_895977 [Mycena floridula]